MPQQILNYEIVRKIGEGGMGQVFLARNKSIHQFVAIKMLHPQFSSNPELREKFRQEAILLSSLDHTNIVKFLNYVENDEGVFLIMEYVDGMTLEDYIRTKSGLIVEERAYPMMLQILQAFAYAHERGIVHQDIKPSNIFIAKDGHIKVLDFGIAKILSDSKDRSLKGRGSLVYMSPEQARNKEVDIRSDIYSLGVVFHEMLTGRPPYDQNTSNDIEILRKIVEEPLVRMKAIYPYVSDFIQSVVDKATMKDPTMRFASCKDMEIAVNRAHISVSRESGGSGGGNNGGNSGNGNKKNTSSKKNGKSGSSKGVIIAVAAALAVIVVGGLGLWLFESNRAKTFFYYSDSFGIAKGISKANDSSSHYILDYSYGKLTSLRLTGPKGGVPVDVDSVYSVYCPVKVDYFYRDKGEPEYKKVYDIEGNLLYKVSFTNELMRAHVQYEKNDSTAESITDFRLTYDDSNGHLTKIEYLDETGDITPNKLNVYGEKFAYDGKGRLSRVTYIDSEGNPMDGSNGVGMISFDYGSSGHDVKSSFYDHLGKPVTPREPEVTKKASSPSYPASKKGYGKTSKYGSSSINNSSNNNSKDNKSQMNHRKSVTNETENIRNKNKNPSKFVKPIEER